MDQKIKKTSVFVITSRLVQSCSSFTSLFMTYAYINASFCACSHQSLSWKRKEGRVSTAVWMNWKQCWWKRLRKM